MIRLGGLKGLWSVLTTGWRHLHIKLAGRVLVVRKPDCQPTASGTSRSLRWRMWSLPRHSCRSAQDIEAALQDRLTGATEGMELSPETQRRLTEEALRALVQSRARFRSGEMFAPLSSLTEKGVEIEARITEGGLLKEDHLVSVGSLPSQWRMPNPHRAISPRGV